jgi:hypothetical protein
MTIVSQYDVKIVKKDQITPTPDMIRPVPETLPLPLTVVPAALATAPSRVPHVAPPRVPVDQPSPSPEPTVFRDITNLPVPASAPRAPISKPASKETPHRTRSTTRIRASPRFKTIFCCLNDATSHHLAQSIKHDPTIAGKMYDPATGRAETIDSLLRGPDAATWITSLSNEWGRCTRGLSKHRTPATTIIGQHTMVFIKPHEVPAGRTITYANFVCTMRPGKSEIYRIRMTIGGDRLEAFQDVRSPAVGIVDTKLHLNSTISDADEEASGELTIFDRSS